MNQLRTLLCLTMMFIIATTITAQNNESHISYAHNDILTPKPPPRTSTGTIKQVSNYANVSDMIAQSYLNPAEGFIGLVFSENIKNPNIYYKIIDKSGREVYNGSAHAASGSTPTLYYNTENLPSGQYRVFVENADFFLSTSFIK